jgi:hypothetical protein
VILRPSVEWGETFVTTLEQQRVDEQGKFQKFNAWGPRANQWVTSMARLQAQILMVGANDTTEVASMLQNGLADARIVAQARSNAAAMGSVVPAIPRPDQTDSVTEHCGEVTNKWNELNTSWLGLQDNILATREATINAEGADERGRMEEIEEVKQFVRTVGATIDTTMSVMAAAPGTINRVVGGARQAQAYTNAFRNRMDLAEGSFGHHNPTYLTTSSSGAMVIRNYQTMEDWNVGTNERSAAPDVELPGLPTSVADIFGGVADIVYSSEIRELNLALEGIKNRCDAVRNVRAFVAVRQKAQEFQDALRAHVTSMATLQTAAEERRAEYLEMGLALDNIATNDPALREQGLAAGGRLENFATIMTLTSAVREVLALGSGAMSGIYSPDDFADWARTLQSDRAARPPRTNWRRYSLGEGEEEKINELYTHLAHTDQAVGLMGGIFAPVEQGAIELIDTITPGGSSGAY